MEWAIDVNDYYMRTVLLSVMALHTGRTSEYNGARQLPV